MRLFVAVDLDEKLKLKAGEIIGELKAEGLDVKFTEPEGLHFTLKFLGEVPENRLPEIKKSIADALASSQCFEINIQGFGYFGSRNFIRVLWAGVKEGKEQLAGLFRKMKVLDYIRADDFEPNPHLTIGRPRGGKDRELLLEELERLKDAAVGRMLVKEVKLKQSVLTGEGPVYSDLEVFPLV
jgi:2'-5' RNA ligase